MSYKGETSMNCCKEENELFTQCLSHENGSITCLDCGKVLYNEKLMKWALRGILSTNQWEEIDILADEYDLVKQTLRADNIDAHESHGLDIDPTPYDSEIKDVIFCNIDASNEDFRNQVWQAIMEFINA